MLLTLLYIVGSLFRPKRQIARMGVDSLAVLMIYVVGIVELFAVAN